MICPQCGIENKNTATFCQKCGRKLVRSSDIFKAPTSLRVDGASSGESVPATRKQPQYGTKDREALIASDNVTSSDSMLPPPPETLKDGRYLILKQLGAGGMGRVFLARDTTMDFRVVVKEMLPFYTTREDKEYLENRFKEEAKLLFRLKHRGLPRVTDFFVEQGRSYLIMEFVEGKDLERIAQDYPKAQVGKKEVVLWMWSVLDILSYVHNQDPPIIHRDIKPANIMLDTKGEIFLVDFGVARALGKNTQTSVGTPGFASMDHFTGDYSASSDLYSLGASFHYLLSGENPQDRKNFLFPPLNKYRNDIPDGLQLIISRMLAMKKEARYTNAGEVMTDLAVLIKGITGEDPPGFGFTVTPAAAPPMTSNDSVGTGKSESPTPSGSMRPLARPMSRSSGTLEKKSSGRVSMPTGGGALSRGTPQPSGSITPPAREETPVPPPPAKPASGRIRVEEPIPRQSVSPPLQQTPPAAAAAPKVPAKKANKTLQHIIIILLMLVIPSCWVVNKIAKSILKNMNNQQQYNSPVNDKELEKKIEEEIDKEAINKIHEELNAAGGKVDKEKVRNYFNKHPLMVNRKDNKGFAPLHKAVAENQPEIVTFLLNKGAKVDIPDNDGRTPLHYAALMGNADIIKVLLSNKTDVNAKDNKGYTSVHYSVVGNRPEALKILLENGAKINEKDKENLTPLDCARALNNPEMANLLKKNGAKPGSSGN